VERLNDFERKTQKRFDTAEKEIGQLEGDKRYRSSSPSMFRSCSGDYPKICVSPDGRKVDYPGRWVSADDVEESLEKLIGQEIIVDTKETVLYSGKLVSCDNEKIKLKNVYIEYRSSTTSHR